MHVWCVVCGGGKVQIAKNMVSLKTLKHRKAKVKEYYTEQKREFEMEGFVNEKY